MGEWDPDEVRRLFTSLEFRSLLDRLQEIGVTKPKVEVTELDLREVPADELADDRGRGRAEGRAAGRRPRRRHGVAASAGRGTGRVRAARALGPLADVARRSDGARSGRTTRRSSRRRRSPPASRLRASCSTRSSPATCSIRPPPTIRCARWREVPRGRRARRASEERTRASCSRERRWRVGRRRRRGDRAARARDGGADRQAGAAGAAGDRGDAARLGARAHGGARRGARRRLPGGDGREVRDRMAKLQAEIYRGAGRGVQPELAAAAARDPVREARACSRARGRRRDSCRPTRACWRSSATQHPVVDALLEWRELDKLNSTYLEALPRLVDPRDGRVHTSFNQAVAATGRLSSSNPNLQNIPVRTRARPADPARVHAGRRRPGAARRRLLADRAPDPRAPVGRRGLREAFASATTSTRRRRPACSGSRRTRSTRPSARARRWSTTGSPTG